MSCLEIISPIFLVEKITYPMFYPGLWFCFKMFVLSAASTIVPTHCSMYHKKTSGTWVYTLVPAQVFVVRGGLKYLPSFW
jgi:hypothetical protein